MPGGVEQGKRSCATSLPSPFSQVWNGVAVLAHGPRGCLERALGREHPGIAAA